MLFLSATIQAKETTKEKQNKTERHRLTTDQQSKWTKTKQAKQAVNIVWPQVYTLG